LCSFCVKQIHAFLELLLPPLLGLCSHRYVELGGPVVSSKLTAKRYPLILAFCRGFSRGSVTSQNLYPSVFSVSIPKSL